MVEQGDSIELTDYLKDALLTLTKPELSRRCKANGLPPQATRLTYGPVPPIPAPLPGTPLAPFPGQCAPEPDTD